MSGMGLTSNARHVHLRDEDFVIFNFQYWDRVIFDRILFFKGQKDKEAYLGGFPFSIVTPYGLYIRFGWRMYWLDDRDDIGDLHEHHNLSEPDEVAPESNNRSLASKSCAMCLHGGNCDINDMDADIACDVNNNYRFFMSKYRCVSEISFSICHNACRGIDGDRDCLGDAGCTYSILKRSVDYRKDDKKVKIQRLKEMFK